MSNDLDEKIEKKRATYKQKIISQDENKPVMSTMRFRNAAFRQEVEEFYLKAGFKTLNDYIMALVRLSLKDEETLKKLKDNL